jgi:hypothetical protein
MPWLIPLELGIGHTFGALEGDDSAYSLAIKDFLYVLNINSCIAAVE